MAFGLGWSPQRPNYDQKFGISVPTPYSINRGKELEIKLTTDHTSIKKKDKVSIKIQVLWDLESFQTVLVNISRYQKDHAPQLHRDKFLYSGPSQTLPYVSLHLAICVLYCILYYIIKLVHISSCFPEFHELFQQTIDLKRGSQESLIYSQSVRSMGAPGHLKQRQSWGTEPLACVVYVRQSVSKLNEIIELPVGAEELES